MSKYRRSRLLNIDNLIIKLLAQNKGTTELHAQNIVIKRVQQKGEYTFCLFLKDCVSHYFIKLELVSCTFVYWTIITWNDAKINICLFKAIRKVKSTKVLKLSVHTHSRGELTEMHTLVNKKLEKSTYYPNTLFQSRRVAVIK